MRVLLADMPFDNLERPALGVSLLKAKLLEDAIECRVLYANAVFATMVPAAEYVRISNHSPDRSLAGDWVFAPCIFGPSVELDAEYLRRVVGGASPEYLEALHHARRVAPGFLDKLLATVAWNDFDIVGFTSTGDQNLAAMALAQRLKERYPGLVVVAGGANWHGSMGRAQQRAFPFVDIGFLGEAEEALPAVVRAISRGSSMSAIPGISVQGVRSHPSRTAAWVRDLEALPPPEFDDYFTAMAEAGLDSQMSPGVCMEASRGCRWAERHACAFCGLSGPVRHYRVKSPVRILTELRAMAAHWPGSDIDLVDNMVPRGFLRECLPELVRRPLGARLFFEARPELTRADLERIAAIGASLQVGVESLSDHVLHLMGKGTTTPRLLRLLNDCRDTGLSPAWNIILGMPGETDEDYREMIALLPSLRTLPPPQVCALFSLVRFSPLFESRATSGFKNVRPSAAYRLTYAVPAKLLRELAAAFEYDEDVPLVRRALRYRLRAEVSLWQAEARVRTTAVRNPPPPTARPDAGSPEALALPSAR